MRGGRRAESASVIEEPRRLSSRLMRHALAVTPVIEEPRRLTLRPLWDKVASGPLDRNRLRAAELIAGAILLLLYLVGTLGGATAHSLFATLCVVTGIVERRIRRKRRRDRGRGERPADRR